MNRLALIQEPQQDINHELIRYVLVLLLMPFWLPFLRALWKELERAMRPDGGLFGRSLRKDERERIEREIRETEESPVVDEPLAHHRRSRAAAGGAANRPGQKGLGAPGQSGATRPAVRRRQGFR